jgi:hypothetical protein
LIYDEIQLLAVKLRLTPSTQYLAAFLAQNYIVALEKARMRITEIEVIEITHTCCLLSAKMRERDIYCPMISMLIHAGGNLVSP